MEKQQIHNSVPTSARQFADETKYANWSGEPEKQEEFHFGLETPGSEDERLFAQWLHFHRFQFKFHPVFEGKTWDFWVPSLCSLIEIKPIAYWEEINPMRKAVFDQIHQGRRTRAMFVEMGRKVPFFQELITPQTAKMIERMAFNYESKRLSLWL